MKKIIYRIFFSICVFVFIFLFLLYGPYDKFRVLLITSSMTTLSHQSIAKFFYSDKVIESVMIDNNVVSFNEESDPDLISVGNYSKNKIYNSKYEKDILKDTDKLYKVIKIKEDSYNGYLVVVYKPDKIHIAFSKDLGEKGELITSVMKREKAVIGMNASGFYDLNFNSNGAIPVGTVISNGKVVSDNKDYLVGDGFIGFNNDNKLILSKDMSSMDALEKGYRDAIEFGPFLIINGKKSIINGNGGWGIAPRSAIGQRKDGIVLFLVINGRIPSSIGATMNDLCNIMLRYGAINASNLDGGSSSELFVKNNIINKPVGGGKSGLRYMPTFFVVSE